MTGRVAVSVALRLLRAEQHFKELEGLVQEYIRSKPYAVGHQIEGKQQEHVYRLRFHTEPDEQIAVVAGDLLHSLRAALNYAMAGLAPVGRKRSVQFPIFNEDPFLRQPGTGKYVERKPNARRQWKTYVKGVQPDALAVVKRMQPYNMRRHEGDILWLSLLNRLDNADKHYELAVIAKGVSGLTYIATDANGSMVNNGMQWNKILLQDGTEVYRSATEVHVEIGGIPIVGLRIGKGVSINALQTDDLIAQVQGFCGELQPHFLR